MDSAQRPPLDADVLVIGAGPVGLTAANLLADQGLRVLLVEREATTSDEPRAISITDESLRVMDQIGILDALRPEMLTGTGTRYFGTHGQLLAQVQPRAPRLGQPVKSQFDQPVLAQLLLDAARSRPRIALRFRTALNSFADLGDHVRAALQGPDGDTEVRARWLLACDGGRSPVRNQLGVALAGSTQEEKWIVVDALHTPGQPEPFSQFHCNGSRPCVVVPGVKGRCRYEFQLLPGDDPQQVIAPESICRLVAPYCQLRPHDIRRAAVYVAQQRVAARFRVGRVLLAGDAAHLMPPFAGQGLNAGLRDASNLAWKLAAHVLGQGTDALVDSYELERRPHVVDMVALSRRIGKIVMARGALATALRDGFFAAIGLVPPAKRWIVEMRFLKLPRFVRGCVVAPRGVPEAAAQLVGRSLPQPMVCRPGAAAQGLDRVLGTSWALLHFPRIGGIDVIRAGTGASAGGSDLVTDGERRFGELERSGCVLFVRPDRYVAAAVTADAIDAAFAQLAPMVPHLRELFAGGLPTSAPAGTSRLAPS